MARWLFAAFLVGVIFTVAVAAELGSSESPVAWFFASWALYALIVFGICAGLRTQTPRAIKIAVFAPLGLLPVLLLFSALSFIPAPLFWLVPGEVLCDFMGARGNDASDEKFAAMDFPQANAALVMHFWGGAPCPRGGAYLVFERTDSWGIKVVHLDPAGAIATVRSSNDWNFSQEHGLLSTDRRIVCVQENGADALWTMARFGESAERFASGTAPSYQKVQLGSPKDHHLAFVAPWPGKGFVVADDPDGTSVAGYSIDGQRQFTIPRVDLMDSDESIEMLQALPDDQFVAVMSSSKRVTPTSMKFDAAGKVSERVKMAALQSLSGTLISFADGRVWLWRTIGASSAARTADVRVLVGGRVDGTLTEKLREQFPFALLPLEDRSPDSHARWVGFPSGTGNLLLGYSEPGPPPTRSSPNQWDESEWPRATIAHFYLVEFASDSTVARKQQVF